MPISKANCDVLNVLPISNANNDMINVITTHSANSNSALRVPVVSQHEESFTQQNSKSSSTCTLESMSGCKC